MALEGPVCPERRRLATVVRVEEVVKHPNADSLSLATVRGWQIVIRTTEFQPGDLAIYCEIDSILPAQLLAGTPLYDVLEPRRFTIKTIRLRGEYSQGILLPVSLLAHTAPAREHSWAVQVDAEDRLVFGEQILELGADVTDLLGVTKHEAPIFSEDTSKPGKPKGDFPVQLLPKTDEERVQNIPGLLQRLKGLEFFVTEKVDGTSYSCYRKQSENGQTFGVCSRNNELLETPDDFYWKVTRWLDIESKLEAAGLNDIALQGELVGPPIQANRYRLREQTVLFFNVYDLREKRYWPSQRARDLVETALGLQWVPVVAERFVLDHTAPQLVAMADGKSFLNPDVDREGLVFRAAEEPHEGRHGRVSFKCISNRYLMKFDGAVGSGAPKQPVAKKEKKPKPALGPELGSLAPTETVAVPATDATA